MFALIFLFCFSFCLFRNNEIRWDAFKNNWRKSAEKQVKSIHLTLCEIRKGGTRSFTVKALSVPWRRNNKAHRSTTDAI